MLRRISRKRYTTEQIIRLLREAEVMIANGATTQQAVRHIGVSEYTYYRWRKKYGGMKIDEAKRLKALEQKNTRWSYDFVADHTADGRLADLSGELVRFDNEMNLLSSNGFTTRSQRSLSILMPATR
jgi:hypothetical protein